MKLLIVLLSSILAARAGGTDEVHCDGVYIKGKYFDQQLLGTDYYLVNAAAVDHTTETLFFSYQVPDKFDTYTGRLNLKTKEFRSVDVFDVYDMTVDSKNRILYLGTHFGIYIYNIDTYQSEFYGPNREMIWSIFYKDDILYYVPFFSQTLYTYTNGEPNKYNDLVNTTVAKFVLDNANNIFFTNNTGLYKLKKDSQEAVMYKSTSDHYEVDTLTLDLHGNVYAGLRDGIYTVDRNEDKIDRILECDVITISFDSNNNIIYNVYDSKIRRLIPSNNTSC